MLFDWDEEARTALGSHLLHSAGIKMECENSKEIQKEKLEEFEKALEDINPQWKEGQLLTLPSIRTKTNIYRLFQTDGKPMGRWWYYATTKNGFVAKDPSVLDNYTLAKQAYEQGLDTEIREKKLDEFEKALQELNLRWSEGIRVKLPSYDPKNRDYRKFSIYKTSMSNWWQTSAINKNGFIAKDPSVLTKYPLMKQAFYERGDDINMQKLDEFETALDDIKHDCGEGKRLAVPSQKKKSDLHRRFRIDNKSMGEWWYHATRKDSRVQGFISKDPSVLDRYPLAKRAFYERIAFQSAGGTLQAKFEDFEKAMEDLNPDRSEGKRLKLPAQEKTHELYRKFRDGSSMKSWWSSLTGNSGFIAKDPYVLDKYPLAKQAYEQRRKPQKRTNPGSASNDETPAKRARPLQHLYTSTSPSDAPAEQPDDQPTEPAVEESDSDEPTADAEPMEVGASSSTAPAAPAAAPAAEPRGFALDRREPPAAAPPQRPPNLQRRERENAEEAAWIKRTKKRALSPDEEELADAYERRQRAAPRRQEPRGYGETFTRSHAEWKANMNGVFASSVASTARAGGGGGLVLVLDDDAEPAGGFGTSKRLLQHRIPPEDLCVVQRDEGKARRMAEHPELGPRVVHADVARHLGSTSDEYRAAYLDLCGSWSCTLRPALEALFGGGGARVAAGPFVLGVTWCMRDPEGSTLYESVAELSSILLNSSGRSVKTIGTSAYTKGSRMCTGFYVLV